MHLVMFTYAEATQYDSLRIHDNSIGLFHDDCIETSMGGVTIRNNTFHTRSTYRTGHPDGIQSYNSYIKIDGNTFSDFLNGVDDGHVNAHIFIDPIAGATNYPGNYQIINNLCVEKTVPSPESTFRMCDVKFSEPGVRGGHDVLIANNTFLGGPFPVLNIYWVQNSTLIAPSNIVVENNLIKDCARVGFSSSVCIFTNGGTMPIPSITYGSDGSGKMVVVDYNLVYASSSLFKTEVSFNGSYGGNGGYSYESFKTASGTQVHDAGSPINPLLKLDYSLANGSPAIAAGKDLSKYFTADKNGRQRPPGAWDIGAYQSSGGVNPAAPSGLRVKPSP
jgi:hypothetical protein